MKNSMSVCKVVSARTRNIHTRGKSQNVPSFIISSVFCSFKSCTRLISEVFSKIPEGSEFVPSQG